MTVPGFRNGDKVWPREGPMVLQRAPQTVIGTYAHPVAGDWLWLDDGDCGFRSYAASHWTTEEPDEAENESRFSRRQQRAAENALPPHSGFKFDELDLSHMYGDPIKPGCTHIMTGGCPIACFSGPCRFETDSPH